MTKELFLRELRIALQGRISQANINVHLRYYENYIMEESRKGKTEQEVMNGLPEPQILAKTIIETGNNRGDIEIEYTRFNWKNKYFHLGLVCICVILIVWKLVYKG